MSCSEVPLDVEGIRLERAGGRLDVILDRPDRKNAVTAEMWPALTSIFRGLSAGRDRVVVLRGAGGSFSSGADLSESVDEPAHTRMAKVNEACTAVRNAPIPTIARVDGVAMGAGMNLALLCDFVVVAEDARLSQVFVRRGLSVDCGGSWILPRLVGERVAKELVLLGEEIDGRAAERLGLATRCLPAAELDTCVDDLAERLAAGPPVAMLLDKQLLNRAHERSFEAALEDEGAVQQVNLATEDVREGFNAFLEHRAPRFRGR